MTDKPNGRVILDRASFLEKIQRKVIAVDLEGSWNCRVYLRQLGGEDIVLIQQVAKQVNSEEVLDNLRFAAELMVKSVCDESGNLLFSKEDIDTVFKDSVPTDIQIIVKKILSVNGWSKDAQEQIEKNSETGQSELSPSV